MEVQAPALRCRKEYRKDANHCDLIRDIPAKGHVPQLGHVSLDPCWPFLYDKNEKGSASAQSLHLCFRDGVLGNPEWSALCYSAIPQCFELPTGQK